jgi:hypothetical protein
MVGATPQRGAPKAGGWTGPVGRDGHAEPAVSQESERSWTSKRPKRSQTSKEAQEVADLQRGRERRGLRRSRAPAGR